MMKKILLSNLLKTGNKRSLIIYCICFIALTFLAACSTPRGLPLSQQVPELHPEFESSKEDPFSVIIGGSEKYKVINHHKKKLAKIRKINNLYEKVGKKYASIQKRLTKLEGYYNKIAARHKLQIQTLIAQSSSPHSYFMGGRSIASDMDDGGDSLFSEDDDNNASSIIAPNIVESSRQTKSTLKSNRKAFVISDPLQR